MNRPDESQIYNSRQVQDLKKLVSQGEGLCLEFKRKAAYPLADVAAIQEAV